MENFIMSNFWPIELSLVGCLVLMFSFAFARVIKREYLIIEVKRISEHTHYVVRIKEYCYTWFRIYCTRRSFVTEKDDDDFKTIEFGSVYEAELGIIKHKGDALKEKSDNIVSKNVIKIVS